MVSHHPAQAVCKPRASGAGQPQRTKHRYWPDYLGIPEYEAKRYEGRVNDGGILVSVHCESSEEIDRAKDVLKQAGEDIASSGEKAVSTHTDNVHTPVKTY